MSQAQVNPSEVPSGPKKKRHRWLLRLFFTILSVAVLSFLIDKERLQWRLRKAILEMDRDHPSWRMEDLEAARAPVPDDVNGALCVQATATVLGDRWNAIEGEELIRKCPANERLPDDLQHRIADELAWLDPAVAAALPLKDRETGRFPPIPQHPNPDRTPLQ